MAPWPLALAVALASGAGSPSLALRPPSAARIAPLVLAINFPALDAVPLRLGGPTLAAPACYGDLCQPRVSVPGHEPQVSSHGRRTELALTMVERAGLEPFAGMARLLTRTGLRVDFAPRVLDSRGSVDRGWGRVMIGVHWRLDACGRPAWLLPASG